MRDYEQLFDNSFFESFLMEVEHRDWPNKHIFKVWSSYDSKCYRIIANTVLEFHYMRTGTGAMYGEGGLPLGDIYVTYGEEYQYWSERIASDAEDGYTSGEPPICIEFDLHLFANRKRELFVRNRNTGLLVVCREVTIEEDSSYIGSMPFPHRIPSDDS